MPSALRSIRWLVSFLVALALAGCGADAPQLTAPVAKGEVVVLTRDGMATYFADGDRAVSGFEYDLARKFAEEIGRPVRFEVVPDEQEILARLRRGDADFAAAWLTVPADARGLRFTRPYFYSHHVLVQHEDSLPVTDLASLAGRAVHVVKGSNEAETLRLLQPKVPGLQIVEEVGWTELDLLEATAEGRVDLVLADSYLLDIASNFLPELVAFLELPPQQQICWTFPAGGDDALFAQAEAYLDRASGDGILTRLKDRYFGHTRRLTQNDVITFLEAMQSALPALQKQLRTAQVKSGIDWRLLAALAYQESQWDPMATSPTGVRGLMMLTEETADRLGVGNRLDAGESLAAGARYLAELREELPAGIREPDRTWLALAAYNLGMGHLNAGLTLARSLKIDPDSWYEMKKVLPLLSRPKYYSGLKSGKARGGEAVIMVENIRNYFDILSRYEEPYEPFAKKPKTVVAKAAAGSGLKPRGATEGVGLRLPTTPEAPELQAIIPPVP